MTAQLQEQRFHTPHLHERQEVDDEQHRVGS
jgi:hypothetical protein